MKTGLDKSFQPFSSGDETDELYFSGRRSILPTEAILSNNEQFTSFSFNNQIIRFATSPKLEKYTRIIEWKHGYIVVMAVYKGIGEVEEYIDLVPILENLYMDPDDFLSPIRKVRIVYD